MLTHTGVAAPSLAVKAERFDASWLDYVHHVIARCGSRKGPARLIRREPPTNHPIRSMIPARTASAASMCPVIIHIKNSMQ